LPRTPRAGWACRRWKGRRALPSSWASRPSVVEPKLPIVLDGQWSSSIAAAALARLPAVEHAPERIVLTSGRRALRVPGARRLEALTHGDDGADPSRSPGARWPVSIEPRPARCPVSHPPCQRRVASWGIARQEALAQPDAAVEAERWYVFCGRPAIQRHLG
jgi:hypothetical protein